MAITGIAPGGSGHFVATPENINHVASVLPPGIVPVWTSDLAGAVLAPQPDGLAVDVNIPADAVPGSSFNLTISAKMPDGTEPTATFTVLVKTLEVVSFVIDQTG